MNQTAPAILDDKSLWRYAGYIDGKWVNETAHGTYPVTNPADGEVLALLPRCKEAETDAAIEAAERAFQSWRKTPAQHRADILRRRIPAGRGCPSGPTRRPASGGARGGRRCAPWTG